MTQTNFEITDNAARKIASLFQQDGKPDLKFRITVLGGGCSGFQYKYDIDSNTDAKDVIFTKDGISVVVDDMSLGFLKDSKIDFVEDLGSAGFEIKNPNATAKCGCGNSFSI